MVFFEKPLIKFERLLETYLANAPRGFASFRMAIPVWIKEKLFQKPNLEKALAAFAPSGKAAGKLLFAEHHQSHAASAFFPSPFEEAVVLTMDGVGEWATTSVSIGRGNTLEPMREIHWPHSVGLLYSAFTYYTGFKVNSGEYKVMGLAPYGEPKYAQLILDNVIDLKEDGSFWLDQSYFNYATGLTMTSRKFHDLFGGPPRDPETWLTQRADGPGRLGAEGHRGDHAAPDAQPGQDVRHQRICALPAAWRSTASATARCCATARSSASGYSRRRVMPAARSARRWPPTTALRIARATSTARSTACRAPFWARNSPKAKSKSAWPRRARSLSVLAEPDLYERTCDALEAGQAVGWFQGRMEFGPRALGARSILGDPRNPEMQKNLNLKIKYRESFRPFAPSVLREDVADYFELDIDSPYMLLVADVKHNRRRVMSAEEEQLFGIDKLNVVRSEIPAVTHVDYSARIQTVHAETNPRYHALLSAFKRRTGCSVLVNTSFNVRGEPIVCTPEDAFRCFMGTEMETLVCGNCYLSKDVQHLDFAKDYRHQFEAD